MGDDHAAADQTRQESRRSGVRGQGLRLRNRLVGISLPRRPRRILRNAAVIGCCYCRPANCRWLRQRPLLALTKRTEGAQLPAASPWQIFRTSLGILDVQRWGLCDQAKLIGHS